MRIYQCVQQLPKLTAILREYSGPHSHLISELFVSPLTVSFCVCVCVWVGVCVCGVCVWVGMCVCGVCVCA